MKKYMKKYNKREIKLIEEKWENILDHVGFFLYFEMKEGMLGDFYVSLWEVNAISVS